MEKIDNAPRNEAQDDVIVLGIASVETMGTAIGNTELSFRKVENGISDD